MHRLLLIPALVLLLTSVPLSAQRGGGHASAGGHGGMAAHGGGFSGHSGGGRGFSGGHSFGGGHGFGGGRTSGGVHSRSGFASRQFSRGSAFHRPISSRGRSRHSGVGLRIRTRDFRHNCFGFGCRDRFGFPWWDAGAFDPSWWWDSGSSYDPDQEREIALANQMNEQSLDEQRMRQQGDPDPSAQSDPPPPRTEARSDAVPSTVLVFRDQRKKEVQNYAIIGQTLWNFAPQHTEKIPLSDLDLQATIKANDERGVDFRLPGSNEGQ